MNSGSEVIWSAGYEYINDEQARQLAADENAVSLVALPIIYQGVITGGLCFKWQNRQGFSNQDVLKIREFAPMAALVGQWEREVSANDRLGAELIRWRVGQGVMSNTKAIKGIIGMLLDIASPESVIIDLNVGFKRYIVTAGKSEEVNQIQEDLRKGLPAAIKNPNSPLEIVEVELLDVVEGEEEKKEDGPDKKREGLLIGRVYVLVNKDRGGIMTRGSSYSTRRAIATLVTDAVLNAMRDGLNSLIKRLGVALSDKDLTTSAQWFSEIESIAEEARLSWAAAIDAGNDGVYGKPECKKIVQDCLKKIDIDPDSERVIQIVDSARVIETASEYTRLILLDDPEAGKHTVISVYLPNTGARIWFGVGREEFGAELSTLSPWATFIARIAELADSALLRLKMQQMQNEAAETRNLATYVVTSHTVFHQIANMVRDIANPLSSLKEAAEAGALNADGIMDLINLSNESATKLQDFAFTFMNVNKMDTNRSCSLLKVIKESRDLLDFSLKSNQISLNVSVPEDIKLDVPFNIAYLAITNLLSNAKDAIGRRGGKIRIDAENVGDMVHCYVINNGPPVDPIVKDQIFHKIGISTKRGQNVHGWGLYLAYRSLIEHRGHIELTSSDSTETKFTIRFPRVKQEQA
ncbi:MAG TPA: HAMP domain-containing sensor histidine kinase [Blastocatellia bacterium]|nr:HAMP domain-containing sensor histidine kinase [Blastocatellia bacterium]